jgi:hypothetical protein
MTKPGSGRRGKDKQRGTLRDERNGAYVRFTQIGAMRPVALNPWRKAASLPAYGTGDPLCSIPITGTVPGCCALAASGQAAAAPPISVMKIAPSHVEHPASSSLAAPGQSTVRSTCRRGVGKSLGQT